MLHQHLRLRTDDGERRVDFVCDARGEQPDRRELFGLDELAFQIDPLRQIVQDHEAPDNAAFFSDQGRERQVDNPLTARGRAQTKLVKAQRRVTVGNRRQIRQEFRRKDFAQRFPNRLRARHPIQRLHRRVPRLHRLVEVDGHHADVDGLDNIFAEFFEVLIRQGLGLNKLVELRVFERDRDVAGDGAQQIDVFAREKVARARLSEPQVAECLLLELEGQVVVKVKALDGPLRGR